MGDRALTAAPHERPQPPPILEAEQRLLGSILLANALLARVEPVLRAGHFLNAVHGRIYTAIGAVVARGSVADLASIQDELGAEPVLAPLGGVEPFLAGLLAAAGVPSNAEHYAREIRTAAVERASAAFSVTSWLDRDIPEPDMLLGLFSTTSRGMFVADTGLGKTNFAMAVAFAMASGQPFLHWNSRRPARVLFIDGEMSKRLLRSRIRDAVKRCGQIPDTLFFVSCDDVEDMPPLNTDEGQSYIDSLLEKLGGADFIFFDNVQSLLCGDMKEEEPWQQTLPWIRDLTRRNIGQLWIHHTGHNTTRSYGTKTREWQLDMVIIAEAIEREDSDIAFSLQFTKARERTPATRADYDPVVVTLASDRWTVEGAAPRKGKLPSPLAQKFLSALHDALAAPGAKVHRFAGRNAVTLDAWRAECRRLGLVGSDKDNLERALLSKYRRELIAVDAITVNGEFVWPQ